MNIQLREIVPLPLRDSERLKQSEVWNRSLSFKTGDWVKIKAPSGTGKTTLVHILWQIRQDYTGKVLYDEKDAANISAMQMASFRQDQLSIIFQDLRLFPQLTARENIEIKRVMTDKPYYSPEKIDEMASRLGVSHILSQKAETCSYGERQRIAIIRALMQPFEWLIMDEPFSHLDEDNIQKAATLISEECKKRSAGFVLTGLDDDDHFAYNASYSL